MAGNPEGIKPHVATDEREELIRCVWMWCSSASKWRARSRFWCLLFWFMAAAWGWIEIWRAS